jgi:hypothetical protein
MDLGARLFARLIRAWTTYTISFKHYIDQHGVEHISKVLNAGGKELKSVSTYDWQPRESKSFLPNKVGFVKNRRARLEDIKDPYLREGWLPEALEDGLLEAYTEQHQPVPSSTHSVGHGHFSTQDILTQIRSRLVALRKLWGPENMYRAQCLPVQTRK